jgi:hypothetical protein
MALTTTDLANIDAAIATGELEVEFNGRRVKYRSITELMAARAHVASVLAASSATTTRRGAYRVDFTTSRGD